MVDGFDNGALRHYLLFDSDGTGLVEIAEPIGFKTSNFKIMQDDGRYGRDVSFAGGDASFDFTPFTEYNGLTHQFDKLLEYRDTYGFEADVKYILRYNDEDYVLGEVDFQFSTTDRIKNFKTKVIQDTLQSTIKRNSDVNVNLLSEEDVDGNTIDPIDVGNILVKAVPLKQLSEWELTEPKTFLLVNSDPTVFLGFTPSIVNFGIEDTLSPVLEASDDNDIRKDTKYVTTLNNLSNVTFRIYDLSYDFSDFPSGSSFKLYVRVGNTFEDATEYERDLPTISNLQEYIFNLETLQRNISVWCYIGINDSPTTSIITIDSAKAEMDSISLSFDSVTSQVRVIDAMRQVVKSISGAEVSAPEFELNGILYDQYLILGNYLRNIDVTTFDLTFDDLLDGLKEFDVDYEVQEDGTIYFGTRDTFYLDTEIESFTGAPSNSFNKEFNKRMAVNVLNWKYNTYEKGQNDSLEDSKEGIHTEAQFKLPNKRVENKKDITCPWIRDPFKIETIRRQGLEVRDSASQENDNDIVIVEGKAITGDRQRSESFQANHVISNTTLLEIINDGSFNWSVIGLSINDIITLSGENPGDYIVLGIGESNLTLSPVSPTPNPTFSGVTYTTIDYTINSTDLVIATNEDFDFIEGSTDPEGFANMSYSIARNIREFYGSYLKACCQYYPLGDILNTLFRHNSEFTTRKTGEVVNIIEGGTIKVVDLKEAILSTDTTMVELPCDFPRFWDLSRNARLQKGFVSVETTEGEQVKIYPQLIEYDWIKSQVIIKGEDKLN